MWTGQYWYLDPSQLGIHFVHWHTRMAGHQYRWEQKHFPIFRKKIIFFFSLFFLASVFLILGVGMDDAFIMLNSWQRHVSPEKSVPQIMKETYEDAAVSITITSLTNIGSFTVGALVPSFYSVSNFCCYIATGLAFIYVWTLVFFGGILALSTRK